MVKTSVEEGETIYTNTDDLDKGWNIIPGTFLPNGIESDSEIQIEDISAMWYYHPLNKEYIRIYPSPEIDKLQQADDDLVLTSAMWIYSKKAGTFKYSTIEKYPPLEQRGLYSGWNFISITPDMIDIPYKDIVGVCVIQKQYIFQEGEWFWFDALEIDSFLEGKALVLKVQDDCTLKSAEPGVSSGIEPPPIPEKASVCEDTDGGINYEVKGTVTDRNSNNAVYTDFCITSGTSGDVVLQGGVVREHYCGEHNYNYEFYNCPNGCVDGACQ
ncbi:MAG: hypothetical protein Q8P57_02825 [Candidatus Pacearchaeota archaeon]|nr:hypothetical protein [Candidatus Pacearchaeota archaeon]